MGGSFVKSQFLKRAGSLGDLAPFASGRLVEMRMSTNSLGERSFDGLDFRTSLMEVCRRVYVGRPAESPGSHSGKFAKRNHSGHAPGTEPGGRKSTSQIFERRTTSSGSVRLWS
jgi:hypothetical protein